MPTGVALPDARGQLFAAAERVLARDGVSGLTSRAVTAEAGCAKGVLHRHFADFDAFLAALVLDRIARLQADAEALLATAGSGTVAGNLAAAIPALLSPVAVAMVALVITRDGLRMRLRAGGHTGLPLIGEATTAVAAYLRAERRGGRLDPDADVEALAATLIGAAHLLFTDREVGPPDGEALGRVVAAVVGRRVSPGVSPGTGPDGWAERPD